MSRESRRKKLGINQEDFEPSKKEPVNISREDFDLLDAEEDGVIYYITEEDGSITMKRGANE